MTNDIPEEARLTPEEIGDNLDLEVEGTYPCSDGSSTMTVSVDKLLQAQLEKAEKYYHPSIEAQKLQIKQAQEEERKRMVEWLDSEGNLTNRYQYPCHRSISRYDLYTDDVIALKEGRDPSQEEVNDGRE